MKTAQWHIGFNNPPRIWMVFVIAISLGLPMLKAQTPPGEMLSFAEFRSIVLRHHPVVQQSDLRITAGESAVRSARGGFDPKLEGGMSQKYYNGTTYYDITQAQIKLPTIAAAEFKVGYDLNDGRYLNPERTVPNDGLIFAGVSVPVLQGLLIDERRAALAMAKAFREFSKADRDAMLNDLLVTAYSQYWDWWSKKEKVAIIEEMLDLATQRKIAVKNRAIAGDRPFIDTLEAHLQVQLRLQQLQEMRAEEVKSRLALSTFIWSEAPASGDPLPLLISYESIPEKAVINTPYPDGVDTLAIRFDQLLGEISRRHPLVLQYRFKLESLAAEERWKKEKLKPRLDVNYHFLNTSPGAGVGEDDRIAFSTNNYKWGFDFSFPLFIRQARGDLQMQRVKIRETELDREQKANELRNKARAALASIELLTRQYEVAQENLVNYEALFQAERTRFFNGESSLFLINQREIQFVEARSKVVDIALKIRETEFDLRWALGALY